MHCADASLQAGTISALMKKLTFTVAVCALAIALAGCATRAVDVLPAPANPADFLAWDCTRIDDEQDLVQQRAADVAYAVDERAGNNILALGVGLTVFWPAILAMRSAGLEAAELARLKGRFEALQTAARYKSCPALGAELPAARAASLPVALGERLVYEDRVDPRHAAVEWTLRVVALRRGEFEFLVEAAKSGSTGPSSPTARAVAPGTWRQDRAGNVVTAPPGALQWPHLLRGDLVLGHVTGGDMVVVGDPLSRARLRAQVVAVGPQSVAGRRFDVAVLEVFGDAQLGDSFTRVEGALVVDRSSGVLLRLDLRSAAPGFSLQRRLMRVEPADSP